MEAQGFISVSIVSVRAMSTKFGDDGSDAPSTPFHVFGLCTRTLSPGDWPSELTEALIRIFPSSVGANAIIAERRFLNHETV
jgi:hypothetical protein